MENIILENNLSAWGKKFCGSRVEIENEYKKWKNTKNKTIEVRTEMSQDEKVVLIVKKMVKKDILQVKEIVKNQLQYGCKHRGEYMRGQYFLLRELEIQYMQKYC